MKNQNEYFTRTNGKAEFKTHHLIQNETFGILDVLFNSELDAHQYSENISLIMVGSKVTFKKKENGQ